MSPRDKQRLHDYLSHILEAIDRINGYTKNLDVSAFLQNKLVQDAVVRNIQRDCPQFVAAHPELPLAFAYEMRNALAHGYFKIDFEIVWKTIKNDLPGLRSQVQAGLSRQT